MQVSSPAESEIAPAVSSPAWMSQWAAPSQDAAARMRQIVLNEGPRNSDLGIAAGVKGFREKAAFVADPFGCQNKKARDIG